VLKRMNMLPFYYEINQITWKSQFLKRVANSFFT